MSATSIAPKYLPSAGKLLNLPKDTQEEVPLLDVDDVLPLLDVEVFGLTQVLFEQL